MGERPGEERGKVRWQGVMVRASKREDDGNDGKGLPEGGPRPAGCWMDQGICETRQDVNGAELIVRVVSVREYQHGETALAIKRGKSVHHMRVLPK